MLESQKKNYLKNFNLWTFVILLILSISSYTIKGNLRIGLVREISSIILYPVEKTITFTKNIFYVHKKNMELRREVAIISLEIQRCANIKKENRILRELYGFKPMNDFNLIPCEIIGKSPGLHNRSIIIDGGLEGGIEKNMPVVSKRGLVGKIIETTQKTSELLTLYNRNSFISVVDLRSRVQGIVNWQGGRFLILEDVPLHSDIKVEDTLLTSGMGGVFPKGIFIGKVVKVEESPKEIVMKIEIEPFVNFSLLEDVFVLTESMTSPLMEIITPDTSNVIMVQLDMFDKIKEPNRFCLSFFESSIEKIGFFNPALYK